MRRKCDIVEEQGNCKEISDRKVEMQKCGNKNGECILRKVERYYITTTSSLIAIGELG